MVQAIRRPGRLPDRGWLRRSGIVRDAERSLLSHEVDSATEVTGMDVRFLRTAAAMERQFVASQAAPDRLR